MFFIVFLFWMAVTASMLIGLISPKKIMAKISPDPAMHTRGKVLKYLSGPSFGLFILSGVFASKDQKATTELAAKANLPTPTTETKISEEPVPEKVAATEPAKESTQSQALDQRPYLQIGCLDAMAELSDETVHPDVRERTFTEKYAGKYFVWNMKATRWVQAQAIVGGHAGHFQCAEELDWEKTSTTAGLVYLSFEDFSDSFTQALKPGSSALLIGKITKGAGSSWSVGASTRLQAEVTAEEYKEISAKMSAAASSTIPEHQKSAVVALVKEKICASKLETCSNYKISDIRNGSTGGTPARVVKVSYESHIHTHEPRCTFVHFNYDDKGINNVILSFRARTVFEGQANSMKDCSENDYDLSTDKSFKNRIKQVGFKDSK